MLKSLRE